MISFSANKIELIRDEAFVVTAAKQTGILKFCNNIQDCDFVQIQVVPTDTDANPIIYFQEIAKYVSVQSSTTGVVQNGQIFKLTNKEYSQFTFKIFDQTYVASTITNLYLNNNLAEIANDVNTNIFISLKFIKLYKPNPLEQMEKQMSKAFK